MKFIAVPGLHACLFFLVGFTLYYDGQVNRPAKRMTIDNCGTLHLNGIPTIEKTLNLLQVDHRDRGIDILPVWGNTGFLES